MTNTMDKSTDLADRLVVDTSLIATGLHATDSTDAIHQLVELLLACGYVSQEFEEAVLSREVNYPTGLPLPVGVAIPHTDPVHVLKGAIAIGVFDQPVRFEEMGSHGVYVDCRIVCMLAVKSAASVVGTIRTLVTALRKAETLDAILAAPAPRAVLEIIAGILPGVVNVRTSDLNGG